jgi:hypothetical protein
MRIFLSVLLFDIAFRSLSVLVPWAAWADELGMRTLPKRLSTRAERARLAARATPEHPDPVAEDVAEALDSVWEFGKPWPGPAGLAKVRSWEGRGKFAFCWLCSRLEFAENLLGFNQEWPMFSPNVSRRRYLARARLTFADGSERVVRSHADPEDLTRYAHWFEEKVLDHELKVREGAGSADECFGYCNLLAHRYRRNEGGAGLVTIALFQVRYDYTPPGVEARAYLRQQTGPPPDQVYPDFYLYDVAARDGKTLQPKPE